MQKYTIGNDMTQPETSQETSYDTLQCASKTIQDHMIKQDMTQLIFDTTVIEVGSV